ncbi:hypothetical protein NIES4072_36860 [Nostoc commune NIES-4072]|uniref:Uncharacterized protein n=1 Tax=Nostoc commune NIES-4072 TaxID=2005467 RepID=A0A2R5FMK6_NOSCO|nr:hypothetical protein [Nostoc commune]BBD68982.1 hypothetical protein NIES4070_53900 [Nostoc commune HK-02]GBG20017.1 hypothetical protein NIES4072_36860 [Nostoc commune NIES-4072]
MNYLVAVLPDRIQAEAAYSALEKAGLPTSQVNILGDGYLSADDFGLIDPDKQARKQSNRLLWSLVTFGFVVGYAFNHFTEVEIFPQFARFGNEFLAGILGGIGGVLGAGLIGRGVGLTASSGDALPYRNRLNAGKYLIAVTGNEDLIREATRILGQFEPENIQGYTDYSQKRKLMSN